MASIPAFSATDSPTEFGAALREAGCAVVHDVVAPDVRDRMADELRPHIELADPEAGRAVNALYEAEADGLGYNDFYQGNTRRVISLIKKSPTFRTLATHPITTAACEGTLKPSCVSYQVHATAAFLVEPGAGTQVLHREEDPFRFLPLPRPNLVTASMWAMSDFTAANGATRLVPGSHRWPEDRIASEGEIVSAEMPAGSALFWTGRVLHGAGANRSDVKRYGLFVSFSVGWVRQEENLYLEMPLEEALALPPEMRELIGYRMHTGLGFSEVYW
jgi:ectoine hydroxylase-related dioxygenase (phytanoyl-CoA dioxygenase family)